VCGPVTGRRISARRSALVLHTFVAAVSRPHRGGSRKRNPRERIPLSRAQPTPRPCESRCR
jgi:hypothetical protein